MPDFKNVLSKADALIGGLLEDHVDEIEKAYLKLDESESMKITMSISLKGTIESIDVKADISFVESRIKDCALATVNGQMKLGEKK